MNVEELLKSKGVYYQSSGRDFLVRCFNPDHEDRHPSMRIDKVLGIFHCLSCGFRGNLFKTYNEHPNPLEIKRESLRRKLQQMRLESIGYSLPTNYQPFEQKWRNISAETYKKFGAFKSTQKEFLNRVVFPIYNISGRIIAFMGRDDTGTLEKKYYIYPGGVSLPPYPTVVPIKDRVIFVEGIFDMLNLHDKGLTNAMTTFGCTTVTSPEYFDILKMQGIFEIDIIYDNDKAGQNGAEGARKAAEKAGVYAHVRKLPDTINDPAELSLAQVQKLKDLLYG